ncbi:MAG TPA: hypothetical protein VGP82_12525 [Ktedonobacterales bacterium]|jgi:hypothetical protein|nr:hypothetical protein [Ktedonobacterales bacterium]
MANAELALQQREGDGQAVEKDFSAVIKLMERLAGLDAHPVQ